MAGASWLGKLGIDVGTRRIQLAADIRNWRSLAAGAIVADGFTFFWRGGRHRRRRIPEQASIQQVGYGGGQVLAWKCSQKLFRRQGKGGRPAKGAADGIVEKGVVRRLENPRLEETSFAL